jgi:hypothetical protein
MGGSNSGRHGGKGTTQGRNILDVRKWQRDRLLIPGYRFDSSWTRNGQPNGSISVIVNTGSVNLIYRHGGDTGQDMNYPVLIDWTQCHYGGKRAWWKCPCCGRRVALLYSGKMFACRHCHRLAYQSTRNTPESQAFARADKVRKRLGWCAGIAYPPGDKPKGMHQQTYERKLLHYYELSNRAFGESSASMDKIMGRLKQIERSVDKYDT